MFIGAVVGVNIGLIILAVNLSNEKVKEKILKQNEEPASSVPEKKKDPFEATMVHYCFACNHKWKEYTLMNPGPNFCPNCGRALDDVEKCVDDRTEPMGTTQKTGKIGTEPQRIRA